MLGMNYGVLNPDKAEQGVSEILRTGMWRDKSVDGLSKCLDDYGELNDTVRRYVAALNVFFALTSLPDQLRKHVDKTTSLLEITDFRGGLSRFHVQVGTFCFPIVAYFGEDGGGEPQEGSLVREERGDASPTFDLLVASFEAVGRP
jgi:hypothetical protein